MIEILNRMAQELEEVFKRTLKGNDRKLFSKYDENLLVTYGCLGKTERNFREIIEQSSISKSILIYEFSKEEVDLCIEKNYLKYCQTVSKSKDLHISSVGLYRLEAERGMDMELFFNALDDYRLPPLEFKFKPQEKLWCIFLIIVGADSMENAFSLKDKDQTYLDKCFKLLLEIDKRLMDEGVDLGKDINWGSGKDINFRKFITNNTDLPKTGIYLTSGGSDVYGLDLSNRKNIQFILELILDSHESEEILMTKRLLYNSIWDLHNSTHLFINEITPELNTTLIDELRN